MNEPTRTWEEIKRIRSCSVYFFPDSVYVVALARTVPGFEIGSEPVLELNRDLTPSGLEDAVVAALNAYQVDVAPPDPRRKYNGPLLKRTGTRSWKQIEKTAALVVVSLDGNIIRAMPTIRNPRQQGYAHRPDLACECALTPAGIGATIMRALESCS